MARIQSLPRIAGIALLVLLAQIASATGSLVFPTTPLFTDSKVPANLVLDTSVEFPTTLLAYRSRNGGIFDPKYSYVGYFDLTRCYSYDANVNEFLPDVLAKQDPNLGYYCNNPSATKAAQGGTLYSGNFLNYISMSAIDLYRQALTGGNRSIDTITKTDLLRAYLYSGTDAGHGGMGVKNYSTSLDGRPYLPFAVLQSTSGKYGFWITNLDTHLLIYSSDPSVKPAPTPVTLNVQVRVCDANNANQSTYKNESNCTTYTDSVNQTISFKPTGELQNNANIINVGLFTYKLDTNKYGGVMRSPVKPLGPTYYSANAGQAYPNSRAEWSATTGIFTQQPDQDWQASGVSVYNAPNSGVINYVNTFGKTGNYKTYDPISTMTSEIARYYRGEELATPSYTKLASTNEADGFPVIANWKGANPHKNGDPEYVSDPTKQGSWGHDPIKYTCQKNFIIAFGDDNTWGDGTFNPYPAFPDMSSTFISDLVTTVNNMETNVVKGGGGKVPSVALGDVGGSYGIAYWLNTSATKYDSNTPSMYGPGSTNGVVPFRVKTYDVDVNETTNNPLYNRRSWMIAKYGGFDDRSFSVTLPGDKNPNITYDLNGNTEILPSEWFTPSNNGYDVTANNNVGGICTTPNPNSGTCVPIPNTYLPVFDPPVMVSGIRSMFRNIASQAASIASVASSTSDFESGTTVYSTNYQAGVWSGTLQAYSLNKDGSINTSSAGWGTSFKAIKDPTTGITSYQNLNPQDAGTILTLRDLTQSPRTMITYNRGIASPSVAFSWNQIDSVKQQILETDPLSGVVGTSTDGKNRLNYLAGIRTQELSYYPIQSPAGSYRDRSTLLGDIVDSSPAVINNLDGTQSVAVGSNDGSLHIFNAKYMDPVGGQEQLAYFPDATFSNVNLLTWRNYNHRFFVDGSLSTYTGAASDKSQRVYLAGGFGYGAPGVFSLDLTGGPTNGTVQFEYTGVDNPSMGYVFDAPQIVRLANKHLALVTGNGFNSSDNQGSIFIFILDDGNNGKTMYQIKTNVGSAGAPGGVAQPFIMVGGTDQSTAQATAMYAGDLQGNVWKVDMASNPDPSSWVATKLYQAWDPNGNPQPITTQVQAMLDLSIINNATTIDPKTNAPVGIPTTVPTNVWLGFGTGKYLEPKDNILVNQQVETVYGLHDQNTSSNTSLGSGRTNLTMQTLDSVTTITNNTASPIGVGGLTYQLTSKNSAPSNANPVGWYFDLPISGERVIADPQILYLSNGTDTVTWLSVPSFIPADTRANACATVGSGYWTVFDLASGQAPNQTFDSTASGVANSPANTNGNRKATASIGFKVLATDMIGSGKLPRKAGPQDCAGAIVGSAGDGALPSICKASRYRTVSWREIIQ